MRLPAKVLRTCIVIFFLGVILYGYIYSNQSKKNYPINTIPIDPVSANDHMRGNKNAQVSIVEYSDFECPECIYFQPTIKKIMNTYGNSIRWIVRLYPLSQHVDAETEAEGAECISALRGNEAFWKFSDRIFENVHITVDGTGLPLSKLPEFAKEVGVNQKDFTNCLQSGKFATVIQHTITNATAANIQQFPSTIVIDGRGNMQEIVGNQPFSVYKNIIDQALTN